MAIIMLTSTAVIVLMAVVITLNEIIQQRSSLYQNKTDLLTGISEIISSRSTAALIFDDRTTAQENLNALQSDSSIQYAAIYQPDGQPFAELSGQASEPYHRRLLASGCAPEPVEPSLLAVCTPIAMGQEHLGEVRILFDMQTEIEQLHSRLAFYAIFLLLLVVIAFMLAWILSYRLQRIISGPILALRTAMSDISSNKDYSVRVPANSSDELGALVDRFNDMLAQIQARDIALARYSSELEQQVQARTAELEEANRKRVFWLENLAYVLRHELKNSTVAIRSSLDLIERRAGTERSHIDKYIQRARASVHFMAKLLENVGSVSTLETDFESESEMPLDLGALVRQQIDTYQSIYQDKTLRVRCEPGLKILGNSTRLIQLLDKLIANAVDYGKADTPIVVTVKRSANQAVLSVANQGQPLPQDKQRIFELFVSQRDAAHKDSSNLGLGLYVVKLIAEAHGGSVEARNPVNFQGAVFIVRLPLI